MNNPKKNFLCKYLCLYYKVFIITLLWFSCIGNIPLVLSSQKNNKIDIIQENQKTIAYSSESKKYILLWHRYVFFPFEKSIENQSDIFTKMKCPQSNCYLTQDRRYLGDISNFDAIIFQGRQLRTRDLPNNRSYHQKYIFFNMESSQHYPACSSKYENFFNWTYTYRLDSDIPYLYIQIKDRNGTIVGPNANVKWTKSATSEIEKREMYKVWENKNRTAFWLASRCHTISRRETKVSELDSALQTLSHNIDLYGHCGRYLLKDEKKMVNNYFFQLAFENSLTEDYVTEKLKNAWRNTAIPVVYGGANYSRFLPPGSYLDASLHSAREVANLMHEIMNNKELFMQYYEWKLFYSYSYAHTENFCAICAALHNRTLMKRFGYKHFRQWWNPDYRYNCKGKTRYGDNLNPDKTRDFKTSLNHLKIIVHKMGYLLLFLIAIRIVIFCTGNLIIENNNFRNRKRKCMLL